MLEMPQSVVDLVRTEQAAIPADQLSGDGLEDWPHVTLLYGIVGMSIEDVVSIVRLIDQVDVVFGQTTAFHNPDATVLKIDIDSPALHKQNARLSNAVPVMNDHPDYLPHMTLGYLKPSVQVEPKPNGLTGKSVRLTRAIVQIDGKRAVVPLRNVQ
jgi:2'-5' RNA ligase